MAPNHTQLQDMMQRNNECFKEYSQRWKGLTARVQPPLMDKGPIDMFMGMLHFQYMEKMFESIFPLFYNVVTSGEWIEIHVKKGKLPCVTNASGGGKNPYSNFQKKQEGETNAIMGGRGNRAQQHILVPYHQIVFVTLAPYPQQIPHKQPYQQFTYQPQ